MVEVTQFRRGLVDGGDWCLIGARSAPTAVHPF
jgi:hypothetical protein